MHRSTLTAVCRSISPLVHPTGQEGATPSYCFTAVHTTQAIKTMNSMFSIPRRSRANRDVTHPQPPPWCCCAPTLKAMGAGIPTATPSAGQTGLFATRGEAASRSVTRIRLQLAPNCKVRPTTLGLPFGADEPKQIICANLGPPSRRTISGGDIEYVRGEKPENRRRTYRKVRAPLGPPGPPRFEAFYSKPAELSPRHTQIALPRGGVE